MTTPNTHPAQLNRQRVRQSFDRAAVHYDAAAVLQREIGDRLLAHLEPIKLAPTRILDVGTGTGYCLKPLQHRYVQADVIALDLALGMVQHAAPASTGVVAKIGQLFNKKRPALGLCADAAQLPLAANCIDLIVSNLAIQWVDDLPALFTDWHRASKVGGLVLFSTFGPDTLKELRSATSAADTQLGHPHTHINRFTDLHDIGDMLVGAGFADPVMEMETLTLTYNDVLDLMRDLKAIGAHNATAARPLGLSGKGWLSALKLAYEQFRNAAGKLPATYEVIYGHAWKPQPKFTSDGAAIVRVDAIQTGAGATP